MGDLVKLLLLDTMHNPSLEPKSRQHYNNVMMTTMASQITSPTVVYSTVYSDADQRKHQSSASLAFVWGIHRDRWIPRTNGHAATRKMFPFDDVIMACHTASYFQTKVAYVSREQWAFLWRDTNFLIWNILLRTFLSVNQSELCFKTTP